MSAEPIYVYTNKQWVIAPNKRTFIWHGKAWTITKVDFVPQCSRSWMGTNLPDFETISDEELREYGYKFWAFDPGMYSTNSRKVLEGRTLYLFTPVNDD